MACGGGPAASVPKPDDVPRMAALDQRLIDRSVDPCTDFFRYACGNFEKLFPIPADRASYGTGSMLGEATEHTLHAILERAAQGGDPATRQIGDAYASCMDAAAIEARGLAPLRGELDRIAALASRDQLPALLAHLNAIGVSAFFSFGEQQDFADARKQIAVVAQGGLGLPERDYYFRQDAATEQTRAQYVAHITKTLTLLGQPAAAAAQDAQAIMALERDLAAASLPITELREPRKIYHLMSVDELGKLAPAFAWRGFFAALALPVVELNVAMPSFQEALDRLLAERDLAAIKAYLRWQLVEATPALVLPAALDAEQFDFHGRKLGGQPQPRARWKRCIEATDGALGEAVGKAYVAEVFSPAAKQATRDMVHDIEAAMAADIDTLDWMSAETKARAHAKLEAVADKIGYPDAWRDYSALTIARDDAYGNFTRAAAFEVRRQLAKIGQPVARGEWGMTASTVDAYYNPSMNDINFPAAILQPPFYDVRASIASNYGHVGGVIGHELTHGFDDEGRQFDGSGNLVDWWTAEDGKRFDDKAACEVDEYGGFVAVDDVKVNGKLTLGENTADNGGLRLAYAAFLARAASTGVDLGKPVDGFTPAQQFFLGHGQNWCGTVRPEAVRLQVQTDPHSPRQFRVNGVVRNMPEFAQAFACKAGQPMAPENRCRVW
jgi:endothelin-converting enzyme/putative endopeptidase